VGLGVVVWRWAREAVSARGATPPATPRAARRRGAQQARHVGRVVLTGAQGAGAADPVARALTGAALDPLGPGGDGARAHRASPSANGISAAQIAARTRASSP